ncbi:TPR and SET domain containing protein [Rhodotorula toruloides]|uniref:TPR and SET domain containing protein n=1 Tax=Rhodotorula toruloides TaxID=5286 RepID=A0A511KJD3_RHOTO|nr:TPR and SET domain containing protein [Rhodotorula toruloides]
MAQPDPAKVLDAMRRAGMDTSMCTGIIYEPRLYLQDVGAKAMKAVPTIAKAFTTVPVDKLPDDFDFKALDNDLFGLRRDAEALKAYTEGLARKPSPEVRLLLRLHRAEVHLRLENFASAYRDSSFILEQLEGGVAGPSQARLKATLRLARAFEGMRHLNVAFESFCKVIELEVGSKEGVESRRSASSASCARRTRN